MASPISYGQTVAANGSCKAKLVGSSLSDSSLNYLFRLVCSNDCSASKYFIVVQQRRAQYSETDYRAQFCIMQKYLNEA